ncbi:unnamed protein product, partial [marine sediment metagenome]
MKMVTIIATLKVKEGKLDEAIEVLKEIVPQIKASEPGTLEYIPHTVAVVNLKYDYFLRE